MCKHNFLITQPAITCPKLTTETLEEGVKYVTFCSLYVYTGFVQFHLWCILEDRQLHTYIYIYMCVCVCVCVGYVLDKAKRVLKRRIIKKIYD